MALPVHVIVTVSFETQWKFHYSFSLCAMMGLPRFFYADIFVWIPPPTVLQTCFLHVRQEPYLTLTCLHHSIVVSLRRSCYNLRLAYYYPATSRSDLTTYDHDVDFFSENQHQRGLGSPASEVQQQQWRATILRKGMTKICLFVMRCYG